LKPKTVMICASCRYRWRKANLERLLARRREGTSSIHSSVARSAPIFLLRRAGWD